VAELPSDLLCDHWHGCDLGDQYVKFLFLLEFLSSSKQHSQVAFPHFGFNHDHILPFTPLYSTRFPQHA
jgi:hypothetical protein